jgi:hypothetical protein
MREGTAWYGMIWDGREMYVIEPQADAAPFLVEGAANDTASHLIYRLSDTLADLGPNFCGSANPSPKSSRLQSALVAYRNLAKTLQAGALAGATVDRQLDVAVVADFEFSNALGAAAESRMLRYMQIVDGIFSSQVGVQINVGSMTVFDTAAQPFTKTADKALLCEVGAYKNSTAALRSAGLVHLFTGQTVDFASSLSEGLRGANAAGSSFPVSALIAAHEIGHNFGAVHDGEAGKACASTAQSFLMAPSINGSSQFSQCSLDTIASYLTGVSCLQPVNPGTANVAARATPQQALLLDETRPVDIVTNSTAAATAANVQLQIAVAGAVRIASASIAGTNCPLDAIGGVCSLGSIAGGQSQTVTVRLRGASLGAGTVDATASATVDGDPADNLAHIDFSVTEAADLAVGMTLASGLLNVGDSATVSLSIDNRTALPAPAATLAVVLPVELTASAVQPTQGSCSTSATGFNCDLGVLAANSANPLTFTVQAVQAGTASLSATIASSLPDPVSGNNSVARNITISSPNAPPPAASGGGGGGGGLDVATLFALFCVACVSRGLRAGLWCRRAYPVARVSP